MGKDTEFSYGHNTGGGSIADDLPGCMGEVKCSRCGKYHGVCSEIAAQIKGGSMLPSGNEDGGSRKNKRAGALEYLTNDMLSTKTPTEAKILAVRYDPEGKFGPKVTLKLAMLGRTIFWSVTTKKNPNFRVLTDELGREENDWVGRSILLGLEQDEFTSNYFCRVSFPVPKGKR